MGQTLSAFWDQTYFIPAPGFTEEGLGDQTGKVHIITGAYTGIALSLTTLLYPKNATIYIAGRSRSTAQTAISTLKSRFPSSTGKLEFMYLDLADLRTIKPAVQWFLEREERLDVLVNNAGVMLPEKGVMSAQGWDLTCGVNVYGAFLLAELLRPILARTAKGGVEEVGEGSVRVVWAASFAIEAQAPEGGVQFERKGRREVLREWEDKGTVYGQSKVANLFLGIAMGGRYRGYGVVDVSFNPGHLKTAINRNPSLSHRLIQKLIAHPTHLGAYTELFAGWSPEITPEMSGAYVIPWGRVGSYNSGLQKAITEGVPEKLWEVCNGITREFR